MSSHASKKVHLGADAVRRLETVRKHLSDQAVLPTPSVPDAFIVSEGLRAFCYELGIPDPADADG